MKYLKILGLPLFMMALLFTSCEKDPEDKTGVLPPDVPVPTEITVNPVLSRSQGANGEGLDFGCFLVNYSFSLIDVEGVEHTLSSDDDLETLFSDESLEIVDFVYPLNVTADEEDLVVNDGEGLAELFAGCVPAGGWEEGDFPAYQISDENSCYSLVYPIDVKNVDGAIVTLEDEDAFNTAVATELVFFVFPFNLIDEDGEEFSVADIDELFDALFGCNDWDVNDTLTWNWEVGFEYIGCYMIEFPFDVTLSDGSIVTVNNHEELCDLMIQGEIGNYVFPITLIDEEGNTVVVGNSEELEELLLECYDDVVIFNEALFLLLDLALTPNSTGVPCIEIDFPLSLVNLEGDVTSVSDLEEYQETILSLEAINLVYPINVTLSADGSSIEITSDQDIAELFTGCF